MSKNNSLENMTCDVCGKIGVIGVASSGLGPVSLAYCEECATRGAEPALLLIGLLETLNHDSLDPTFFEQVTYHDNRYMTMKEFNEQYSHLVKSQREAYTAALAAANDKLEKEMARYKNHPNAEWLNKQIEELSEIVRYLKKNNKPHRIVSYKLAYAYAVKEFLITGRNINHKGRGRNSSYLWMRPRDSAYYRLIEEINNPDLSKFCYRVMQQMFTYEQMQKFMFSPDRRTRHGSSLESSSVVRPTADEYGPLPC